MQQVSAKHFLQAAVPLVDARMLPVPARRAANRALVTAGHVWVLHRRRVLQTVAAMVALGGLVGLYHARDLIGTGAMTAAATLSGEFTSAGFAIHSIDISGQSLTSEADVFLALGIDSKTSTVSFDAQAARDRLIALPAIKAVTIRKIYPDRVVVTLTEKIPVARWRVGGFTYLVDPDGGQIALDSGQYPELPLVVGEGANDDALVMLKSMERFTIARKDLAALSRIGDRRWDLIYRSGLRVQLPETGVAQALTQLETYQKRFALLDRDITLIDLRVPGLVIYKRAVREPVEPAKTEP